MGWIFFFFSSLALLVAQEAAYITTDEITVLF